MRTKLGHSQKNGWVSEPSETYHSTSSLSSSALKQIVTKTPAHFKQYVFEKKPPTPAMQWGTTVHSYLLEDTPIAVMPEFNLRTNEGKAQKAQFSEDNAGSLICTEDEALALKNIMASVRELPLYNMGRAQGVIETSGYSSASACGLKIRPDIRSPDNSLIIDLKTTQNAGKDAFSRDVFNLGYHIQAAYYLYVANLIEPGNYSTFAWIAVEKEPPYCSAVYIATPEYLELGAKAMHAGLAKIAECLETNTWPGYPTDLQLISPPSWAVKNEI